MNYNCVILAGVVMITTAWWFIHATKHYPGPTFNITHIHDEEEKSVATENGLTSK